MDTISYEISVDKDKREMIQKDLIKEYSKSLVTILVDFSDKNRDNASTKNIIQCMERIFEGIFTSKIFLKINWVVENGPILIMIIDSNEMDIKKTCVEIEEKHILGGCVIINVYDSQNREITREEINYQPKKCFICGELLENCKRTKKHTVSEIKRQIQLKYNEYLSNYEDRL